MSVITISRGTFSGGKLLAEKVADKLDYRCLDRDVIVEKAAAYGVSQDELRTAMEEPPGLLERFRHKRYLYLALMQAALAEEVRTGKEVYQGHVGHLLLKGGGPVFRVRVIAPLELRVSMAQHRLNLTRNEVIAYIRKIDQDRKKWAHYLYGVNWEEASLYDLVINLQYMDIEDGCDIVATAARKQACFNFDAKCQSAMDDLARASRVKADIALNPETSDLELEVQGENGVVRISGKAMDADQIMEIRRIAGKVVDPARLNLDNLRLRTPS
jgi:cytidylate kinase